MALRKFESRGEADVGDRGMVAADGSLVQIGFHNTSRRLAPSIAAIPLILRVLFASHSAVCWFCYAWSGGSRPLLDLALRNPLQRDRLPHESFQAYHHGDRLHFPLGSSNQIVANSN